MADILQTVKRVLSSPSARRIDFHLGLINVDAAGLAAIHSLVSVGTISVKVVKSTDMVDAGVESQYDPTTNSLQFIRADYGSDDYSEEAGIVHECIHGLHDFYGAGYYYPRRGGANFITRSENEAAAYLAASLYFLYETGKPPEGDGVFDIAGMIAKRIMNKRGAFVTPAEANALRIAIALHPIYRSKFGVGTLTTADGP